MTPIQQLMLGVGGAKKTYMDEVFNTFLYIGDDGFDRAIDNGLDINGEGGMVTVCNRSGGGGFWNSDTVRGMGKHLRFYSTAVETGNLGRIAAATGNDTGFRVNNDSIANANNNTYTSNTFIIKPGFFDIVTWDGTSGTSNRTISHNLGCVPGMILVKAYEGNATHWCVYHRNSSATPADTILSLNNNWGSGDSNNFGDTAPTSTEFTVSDAAGNQRTNGDTNRKYIAYLFAGGESTASTATSCNFLGASSDGDDNKIWVGNASDKTADLVYGTGDFTWEAWFNPLDSSNAYKRIIHHGHEWNQNNTVALMWDHTSYNNTLTFWSYALNSSNPILTSHAHVFQGTWNHVAVTRSSGTFRLFVNGVLESTNTSYSASVEGSETSNYATIGATHNSNQQECFRGNISNVRIVKGTAVYTSSFRPPTEPLTNITNTKLLCCNGSSTTSATVTPKTLVSDSTVTINTTNSPFDDPAGFVFGDSQEGIIKCGSYIGNGSAAGPEINLGWEPQWVLLKNITESGDDWRIYDNMRGIITGSSDFVLYPNSSGAEAEEAQEGLELTPTGFKVGSSLDGVNESDKTFIYTAIRRPDGYVGKPRTATELFAMDTGGGGSTIPQYDSGFPVDFALRRQPAASSNWIAMGRLIQGKYLMTNSSNAEDSNSNIPMFDSNVGFSKTDNNTHQGWMWKRGAGFDLVSYDGQTNILNVPHSLNAVPEMIWVKARTGTAAQNQNWKVYHKGLNGGTTPQNYYLSLNGTGAENTNANSWNNTAPTSTHFTLGSGDAEVNYNNYTFLAMLFASVDGISKCGYFDGSDSEQTITTGFQPRLLILKSATGTGENWYILDTTRGWASGNDTALWLNTNHAQWSSANYGAPTSTGFTLPGNHAGTNDAGQKYIYYAHA